MSNKLDSTNTVLGIVRHTIESNSLIAKGDKILVALSGGADSVCLLDVLCRLKKEFNIKVGAAHLNHMIRGAEADRDEAYAAELCTKLSVPFYADRINVPKLAETESISEELAGRKARYGFFKKICDEHGYNVIATAHNRNDRAETVLMRIMRGTGIDGLKSIQYKRDDGVVRPILDVSREDIEKYCHENNLEFCTDSTNSDNNYTRNSIRNELLPMIQERFNPRIIDALCALSDNSKEDADFLNGYAERLYRRINSPMPNRSPKIMDIESLTMVGDSIRNRLITICARDVMGDDYKLERTHIEAVNDLLDKETGASVKLLKGLNVSVKYGWLEFMTDEEKAAQEYKKSFCYEIEFDIDNSVDIDAQSIKLEITEEIIKPCKNRMILDYDKILTEKLFIRNRKIGDKIVLYKDGKKRKLKDYFIDMKIPRNDRDKIPLLCTENEVLAIIGYRVAETFKPTAHTKKGLVITYGADNEDR